MVSWPLAESTDVGVWNISAYHRGMMGGSMPNIDRIAREGALFEEEPEDPDYPEHPELHKRFGPGGLLDCKASDKEGPTQDPRFGRIGNLLVNSKMPGKAVLHMTFEGQRG
jgi:hypothetical protein